MPPKNEGSVSVEEFRQFKTEIMSVVAEALEEMRQQSSDGKAKLKLYELLYETKKEHIFELSNISGMQVRPTAIVQTLAHIGDPDVKSGKISLAEIYIENIFRNRRSVDAKHLMRGNMLAGEQLNAEAEEASEGLLGTELGKE